MKTLFNQEVLSPAETGARIGVCENTVKAWLKAGLLKAWKIGTRTYIPLRAVDALAEAVKGTAG